MWLVTVVVGWISLGGSQVDSVLPGLAAGARGGDQRAMVLAAALMRPCLRRIAGWADPDGFDRTDPDARASFTLEAFYNVLVSQGQCDGEPLTSRVVYRLVLRAVLDNRKNPCHGTIRNPLHPQVGNLRYGHPRRRYSGIGCFVA